MVIARHEALFCAVLLLAVGSLATLVAVDATFDLSDRPVVVGCRCPDLSGGE